MTAAQPPFKNEREFTRWFRDRALEEGWRYAHFGNTVRFVRRSEKDKRGPGYATIPDKDAAGFPDCVLVRERLMIVELKLTPNKPTGLQIDWLESLRDAGVETHVFNDRQIDEILATLRLRVDPQRLARLVLASDGNVDHSIHVAQMIKAAGG